MTSSTLAFLNNNSGAIQAISTSVLVIITALYAFWTWRMARIMTRQITPEIKVENIILGSSLWEKGFKDRIQSLDLNHYISFKLTFDVRNSGAGSGSIDKPLLILQFKENNYTLQPKTKESETRPSATNNSFMSIYDTVTTDLGGTIYLHGGASENIELEYHIVCRDFPKIIEDIKRNLESIETYIIYKDNFGRPYKDPITRQYAEDEVGRS